MNIITGKNTDGNTVWIWVDHICALIKSHNGGCIIRTVDGHHYYMRDNAETVLKTIDSVVTR